jgi:hypothetical protein
LPYLFRFRRLKLWLFKLILWSSFWGVIHNSIPSGWGCEWMMDPVRE